MDCMQSINTFSYGKAKQTRTCTAKLMKYMSGKYHCNGFC